MNPDLLPYPYFDDAERDRRWGLVRAAMARDGVDCLVVPNNTGHSTHFQADARYLTHVGGGGDADVAAVFPMEGEPAAVVTQTRRWVHTQPWTKDLREAGRAYGAGALTKLQEVPLPNKRVGIVGLRDYVRAPEGTALLGFMHILREGMPGIEWVNFSDPMEDIRLVKSDAEVAFLEQSMKIVNAGYEAARRALKPGVKDYAVWGAAMGAVCQMGSEIPVHQHWVGGHEPTFTLTRPTHADVEEGWIFLSELEAAYGGYHAQGDQPLACGQPKQVFQDLFKFDIDLWNETFARLKPGITVRELDSLTAADADRLAPKSGPIAGATGTLMMHGRGLGSDAPLITGHARGRDLERTIEPGWCFVFKPTAKLGKLNICWGDTVAITKTSARRLGNAPQEILIGS
ncbi:MAG: M24 family metallopeptidase [Chloroflexi bacterium]|nr:M24 family metallopeptidase [Chloroflexota bacterium]